MVEMMSEFKTSDSGVRSKIPGDATSAHHSICNQIVAAPTRRLD